MTQRPERFAHWSTARFHDVILGDPATADVPNAAGGMASAAGWGRNGQPAAGAVSLG